MYYSYSSVRVVIAMAKDLKRENVIRNVVVSSYLIDGFEMAKLNN